MVDKLFGSVVYERQSEYRSLSVIRETKTFRKSNPERFNKPVICIIIRETKTFRKSNPVTLVYHQQAGHLYNCLR